MLSSVPGRLDYHEKLIGRFVKLLLNNVLGTLNMVTFHHLTGHKTAPSRLEQKQPSRGSNGRKNKNRNQEPFHPKRTHKGSVHPAPCSSGPLQAPETLAAKNRSHYCLLSMSLADFSGISSLLAVALSSFTTSYSGFLLPVSDWRKTGQGKTQIYPSFI